MSSMIQAINVFSGAETLEATVVSKDAAGEGFGSVMQCLLGQGEFDAASGGMQQGAPGRQMPMQPTAMQAEAETLVLEPEAMIADAVLLTPDAVATLVAEEEVVDLVAAAEDEVMAAEERATDGQAEPPRLDAQVVEVVLSIPVDAEAPVVILAPPEAVMPEGNEAAPMVAQANAQTSAPPPPAPMPPPARDAVGTTESPAAQPQPPAPAESKELPQATAPAEGVHPEAAGMTTPAMPEKPEGQSLPTGEQAPVIRPVSPPAPVASALPSAQNVENTPPVEPPSIQEHIPVTPVGVAMENATPAPQGPMTFEAPESSQNGTPAAQVPPVVEAPDLAPGEKPSTPSQIVVEVSIPPKTAIPMNGTDKTAMPAPPPPPLPPAIMRDIKQVIVAETDPLADPLVAHPRFSQPSPRQPVSRAMPEKAAAAPAAVPRSEMPDMENGRQQETDSAFDGKPDGTPLYPFRLPSNPVPGRELSMDFTPALQAARGTPVVAAHAPVVSPGMAHALERTEHLQQMVDRLDQHVLSLIKGGEKSLSLTLTPKSLGKITLNCREQPEGAVAVEILAENQTVRGLLQDQAQALRQALEQQGFKMTSFEVNAEAGGGRNPPAFAHDQAFRQAGERGMRTPLSSTRMAAGPRPQETAATAPEPNAGGIWFVA